MAGQNSPAGIEAETHCLGNTEHHRSQEGAPDRTHAADDDSLEGVDQLRWTVGGETVERSDWKTAAKPRIPTASAVAKA
ncbi:hypothetical protein SAMN05216228_1009178 [Rhizobium tibeticum]|uniref:Uncharacterized protein n=1 Tax=Rhizobium tibeticum TaxID=501024 RepID=A0A1H8KSV3_9HYPH|nr:hypothetical protein RTCCBAU85039_2631 [Rhizobium tibeticum]SEN95901.1 hypothetical protein SAMN05216228_1009178 [Rhizobium tibeticum]